MLWCNHLTAFVSPLSNIYIFVRSTEKRAAHFPANSGNKSFLLYFATMSMHYANNHCVKRNNMQQPHFFGDNTTSKASADFSKSPALRRKKPVLDLPLASRLWTWAPHLQYTYDPIECNKDVPERGSQEPR